MELLISKQVVMSLFLKSCSEVVVAWMLKTFLKIFKLYSYVVLYNSLNYDDYVIDRRDSYESKGKAH